MAFSDAPWDGSASNYPDAASYCDACLVNDNTGDRKTWTKDKCALPVKNKDGVVVKNALSAAAARLNQTKTSPENKKAAARKLVSYYRQAKMDVPPSLKNLAQ